MSSGQEPGARSKQQEMNLEIIRRGSAECLAAATGGQFRWLAGNCSFVPGQFILPRPRLLYNYLGGASRQESRSQPTGTFPWYIHTSPVISWKLLSGFVPRQFYTGYIQQRIAGSINYKYICRQEETVQLVIETIVFAHQPPIETKGSEVALISFHYLPLTSSNKTVLSFLFSDSQDDSVIVVTVKCNITFNPDEMTRKATMFSGPNSPLDNSRHNQKSHEQAILFDPPPRESLLKKDQALTIIFGAI